MIIKTDSNSNGTFYWDNVEKRTRFVRKGETPEFEVVENPETMLHVETPEKQTIETTETKKQTDDIQLLTVKQLREVVKDKGLDVPANADKKTLIDAIVQADEDDE
ncbi:hypothetical protein HCB49_12880 [Listeria sp. FSL L7-0123]|uniref:HeH/LEM domain-containing protein n=1 Tax=Listeria cossartiae subsp. cayugensis TaxID=2713505 RepID=A0A7X0ZEH7_9LIST|nr:hypothetical protein [Listeria cossartiae]MBC2250885.1 hypothetical protein [Listeria cossartiae subsp. cayugensis]